MSRIFRAVSIGAILGLLGGLLPSVPVQAAALTVINQCPSISCDRASGNYYSTRAYSASPGTVTVRLGEVSFYGGSYRYNSSLKTSPGTQALSIEWRWRQQNANYTFPGTYQSEIHSCGTDLTSTYCSDQIHLDTISITGLTAERMVQIQFRLINEDGPTEWYADVQSQSLRHIEARVRDFTPTANISHDEFGTGSIFVHENESFTVSAIGSTPNDDTYDVTQSSFAWNMYHGMPFQNLSNGFSTKSHSYNVDGTYVIQVRIRNSLGEIDTETRTVYVSDAPSSSTPSLSLSSNRTYTNQQSEVFDLVWPRFASSMNLSDGTSSAVNVAVGASLLWNFGWGHVEGEMRTLTATFFDRAGGQLSTQLSQNVTFDSVLPVINNVSATQSNAELTFSISAYDQHSGVEQVEISNGTTTNTYAYSSSLASSMSGTNFSVRVRDLAGNWSESQNIVPTTTVNSLPSVQTSPTSTTTTAGPAVASIPLAPSVARKSKTSSAVLARNTGMQVAPGSKISIIASKASNKICKVSSGKLVALKPGKCKITLSVTPKKSKLVKKPKTLKKSLAITVN